MSDDGFNPWSLLTGGISGLFNIWGASKQASAMRDAARMQTDAANRAADLQSRATAEALAFQKEQAGRDFTMTEANRHANYDQWAAGQRRLGTVGQMLGLGSREIPGYVPLPGSPQAAAATANRQLAAIDPSKGDLGGQISAYFKAQGVSDQETPYWVGKWNELTARGQQLNDPNYALKRLADADVFRGGQPASSASAPAPYHMQPVGSYLAPSYQPSTTARSLVTPALQMPDPYRVGSVGSYL